MSTLFFPNMLTLHNSPLLHIIANDIAINNDFYVVPANQAVLLILNKCYQARQLLIAKYIHNL